MLQCDGHTNYKIPHSSIAKQSGTVQLQRTSSYNILVVPSFLLLPDVDECAEGLATCGAHAQCVNLPGSHSCHCQSGYELGFDGRTCVGEFPRFSDKQTRFPGLFP